MDDDFQSRDKTGFNDVTKAYKADPSIQNYVNLRKLNPDIEIEIATNQGMEFVLTHENEIRDLRIDPSDWCLCLDADENAQSRLSLLMIEKIIDRDKIISSGKTHTVSRHNAIGDAFVNYFIRSCLDALSWNDDLTISRDLIVLIKHQLHIFNNTTDDDVEKKRKASNAAMIAAQLLSKGVEPSYRLIGSILGVSASTVKRWFPNGDFRERTQHYAGWFENGQLKPLFARKREKNKS
ncbi:hypothetical protein [Rhodoblastus sp.]|uniref:hypothetical protein n=1 Tax=Rhodoblastus sp. TaxID=1962975 RepID=UPI0035AF35CC